MSTVAGIHILTDRKAKIMTLIKASMRDAENAARIKRSLDEEAEIGEIKGEEFNKIYEEVSSSFGDALSQDKAIVLFDDYVSVLFEDCEVQEIQERAASYSEVFEKPCVFCVLVDSDALIFGIAANGKVCTRRVLGEYLDEYSLEEEKINMDYFRRYFNSSNLTDLNLCDNVSDVLFAIEEDYGIVGDISPLTVSLFDDKFKLLEKSETFCVWTTLE